MKNVASARKYRWLKKHNRRGKRLLSKFAHEIYLLELLWAHKLSYRKRSK